MRGDDEYVPPEPEPVNPFDVLTDDEIAEDVDNDARWTRRFTR